LQESSGKKISISSACLASSAPATTALRWLAALEQNGLVEKEQDSSDGRRQFVRPTHKSRTLMQKLLDEFPD
jgi:DNA-binding MarR family transcriptional regulator